MQPHLLRPLGVPEVLAEVGSLGLGLELDQAHRLDPVQPQPCDGPPLALETVADLRLRERPLQLLNLEQLRAPLLGHLRDFALVYLGRDAVRSGAPSTHAFRPAPGGDGCVGRRRGPGSAALPHGALRVPRRDADPQRGAAQRPETLPAAGVLRRGPSSRSLVDQAPETPRALPAGSGRGDLVRVCIHEALGSGRRLWGPWRSQ
mmetsp:Transcript_48249/g.114817  ORF Transcript_48249/g.114817 Transcript_48249/m.114817 type:complete len:204 (+) Transcript_48249:622-1233(+)